MASRFRRRWLLVVPIPLVLFAVGFVIWAGTPQGALMDEAIAAMQSDTKVTVHTENGWLVFAPLDIPPDTGLIFYPGARVQPEAYAPAMRAIAEAGYLAIIVPMPLNLAVFDAGAASRVVAAFPEIAHWAIGGHSLGGTMAASYVYDHPDTVAGLILWGSYPATWNDLSARETLVVASVYGELDGLTRISDIEAARPLLPANTAYTLVRGGNHAYFGWYGSQPGDNPAVTTREEQQAETIAATLNVLRAIRD